MYLAVFYLLTNREMGLYLCYKQRLYQKFIADNMLDDHYGRACQGDEEAENELFKHLLVRFRFIARRKIKGNEAEDVVQKALKSILGNYKTVAFRISFWAWAYGVLQNKIKDYFKDKNQEEDKFVSLSEVENLLIDPPPEIDPEFERKLVNCLKQIMKYNIDYARALNLTYQGYKAGDIARKLKVNINNLYVILHRARAMIDLCLKKGKI